jgi:guanylate kinase
LVAKYPDRFGFSVSYTTRKPRQGETHGVHYHFIEKEEFEQKIFKNEFIEYCNVHTNMYGTEKAQVTSLRNSSIIPLLDIDIQGAKKMYAAFPESNFIFLCPPSI